MDLHVLFFNAYEGNLYYGYINALFFSKKYGGSIITHQEYIDAELKYDSDFLNILDLGKITEDDRKEIMQFGIPREFFLNLEEQYASKTQALLHLIRERDDTLEKYLYAALNAFQNQIDRIYVYGETYESVKYIANERNITIINYEYTTVRKPYSYTCNLMWALTCGNLYSNREMLDRYTNFCDEIDKNILLKREELIALFVPKRQIMFIPLIYEKSVFEVGILNTGCGVLPVFSKDIICTDDDAYYMCRKYYRQDEITQRKHPATLSVADLECGSYERETLPFILSCKRVASVSSNGLFEAMLWGRTSCIALDAMAFYFMCEHDFRSEKIVDETFLNFYLIAALVPSPILLFDPHYWEMRAKMSEVDLYHYHLNYIFDLLGINRRILDLSVPERLDTIIASREVDPSVLLKPQFRYDIPFYNNLRSELCIHSNGREKTIECVNYLVDDEIISSFNINETIEYAEFYPHKEKTGFVEIRKVLVDGKEIWKKNDGLEFALLQYKKELTPLPFQLIGTLQVIWKSDVSIKNFGRLIEEHKILNAQMNSVYNSFSWRITKPLRKIGGAIAYSRKRN